MLRHRPPTTQRQIGYQLVPRYIVGDDRSWQSFIGAICYIPNVLARFVGKSYRWHWLRVSKCCDLRVYSTLVLSVEPWVSFGLLSGEYQVWLSFKLVCSARNSVKVRKARNFIRSNDRRGSSWTAYDSSC